jgi:hypothetical protein
LSDDAMKNAPEQVTLDELRDASQLGNEQISGYVSFIDEEGRQVDIPRGAQPIVRSADKAGYCTVYLAGGVFVIRGERNEVLRKLA